MSFTVGIRIVRIRIMTRWVNYPLPAEYERGVRYSLLKKGLFNLFPETSPEAPACTEEFGSSLFLSRVLVSCLCGSIIEALITLINGSQASSFRQGWKEVKKSEISFTKIDYHISPPLKALYTPFYHVCMLSLK